MTEPTNGRGPKRAVAPDPGPAWPPQEPSPPYSVISVPWTAPCMLRWPPRPRPRRPGAAPAVPRRRPLEGLPRDRLRYSPWAVRGRAGRPSSGWGGSPWPSASANVLEAVRCAGRGPTGRRRGSRWTGIKLMPASASFPSGHTASAVAFATAVGVVLPAAAVPLGVGERRRLRPGPRRRALSRRRGCGRRPGHRQCGRRPRSSGGHPGAGRGRPAGGAGVSSSATGQGVAERAVSRRPSQPGSTSTPCCCRRPWWHRKAVAGADRLRSS